MKLLRSLLFVAVTGLLFSASVRASSPVAAREVAVGIITQPDGSQIQRGTTQMTARRQLGAPHQVLAPDVWVYFGYHASRGEVGAERCDTLIVMFHAGQVSDLKIVNPAAVTTLAASLKSAEQATRVARK